MGNLENPTSKDAARSAVCLTWPVQRKMAVLTGTAEGMAVAMCCTVQPRAFFGQWMGWCVVLALITWHFNGDSIWIVKPWSTRLGALANDVSSRGLPQGRCCRCCPPCLCRRTFCLFCPRLPTQSSFAWKLDYLDLSLITLIPWSLNLVQLLFDQQQKSFQEFQIIFAKEIDRYLAKLGTRGKTSAGWSLNAWTDTQKCSTQYAGRRETAELKLLIFRDSTILPNMFPVSFYQISPGSYCLPLDPSRSTKPFLFARPRWTATFAWAEAFGASDGRNLISDVATVQIGAWLSSIVSLCRLLVRTFLLTLVTFGDMCLVCGCFFLDVFWVKDSILKRLAMTAPQWGLDQDVRSQDSLWFRSGHFFHAGW